MQSVLQNLLSVWFYFTLYLFTLFMLGLGIISSRIAPRRFFLAAVKIWANGLFILLGKRLHVKNRGNYSATGRYIILINHTSFFDIPAIMAVFPNVSWLGKEYLTKIPLFNRILKEMNYIAVEDNPARSVHRILRQAQQAVNQFQLALFPEGTRTLNGNLGRFKRGFIHIMRNAQMDILPVTLNGLFEIKPKDRWSINPFVRAEMVIGDPIPFSELSQLSTEEIINRTIEAIAVNLRLPGNESQIDQIKSSDMSSTFEVK
ncbi:MAG: 1-acyl-sn-glycerol-3-phosphate acyltransferase [Calditrichaeota bacterium]|nr:MAG: 1-acyl-sn-glycerol-3-phosphate acyltransferase [Calditrichota bacterium]